MKVCVIGYKGNMGSRYVSILKRLRVDWVGVEQGDKLPTESIKHFIVATPTNMHINNIAGLGFRKEPVNILVEKPVTILSGGWKWPAFGRTPGDMFNSSSELTPVKRAISRGHKIFMVNQYAYSLVGADTGDCGLTLYDYYSSGGDGLPWDCIQLLHLARGEVSLSNDSPIWHCILNGKVLGRDSVDYFYVRMIEDFVSDGEKYGKLWGWDDIKRSHEKSLVWSKNINWSSGKKHFDTT